MQDSTYRRTLLLPHPQSHVRSWRLLALLSLASILLLSAPLASAATWYVAANGSDSNSGRSADAPLRTPEAAFGRLSNGDSLFLRAGDRFTVSRSLRVSVSGSSSQPVVIGAYRMASGGRVDYRVDGARPVLDGRKSVPSPGSYVGLIHVTGRHVEVRDIEIRNSGGIGIRFAETEYGRADNVRTDWTYRFGIQFFRSRYMEMTNCEIRNYGAGWYHHGENDFPNGASIRSTSDAAVRGCRVYEGWGEGINSFYGNRNVVIEHNIVYAAHAVGIYIDSTRNADVRYNIVLGTADSTHHRYGSNTFTGPGIALNNERYQFSTSAGGTGGSLDANEQVRNVRIHNNMVAGTRIGLAFFGQLDATRWDGIQVAHNSFIDNDSQIASPGSRSFSNSMIANNIFLSLSSGARDHGGEFSSSGLRWQNNYWSQGQPPASMRSSGDRHQGLALKKMSGWQQLRSFNDVSWSDFMPSADSATIEAGATLANGLAEFDLTGASMGTPPDMGALSHLGAERPAPPRALTVVN